MNALGTVTKTEKILLGLTALFLCLLAVLFFRDHQAALAAMAVETEREVSQEEILPDLRPLDLNTATAEELETLPGIGDVLARRIVDYRTEYGPFAEVNGLLEVSGIGDQKLEAIESLITVR